MKDIVELKDYRARLAYDRERREFARIAEPRPRPPAEPFVAFAWMRMPDARASLPTGARLPGRATRAVAARHGGRVRVRCRLPDIDGEEGGAVIIE